MNEAPDRRAAAEMVLIRLAHVAELPTPGDLVRRLTGRRRHRRPAPRRARRRMAAAARRAAPMGGGGAVLADAVAAAASANPQCWREVVALASGRKPMLHAHLVTASTRCGSRPAGSRSRVLPARRATWRPQLGALLRELTGTRWTIALSNAEGEPTLAEQGRAAEAGRRAVAQSHPLVQAVLAAFPGASIEAVRDAGADAYGLGGARLPAAPRTSPSRSRACRRSSAELEEPADFDDVPPPDDER